VLKVIEGEVPDPFNNAIVQTLTWNLNGPMTWGTLPDPFGNWITFDFVTPSPATSPGYLLLSFCFAYCPNVGTTPPNSPGIWLFNSPPYGLTTSFGTANWILYVYAYLNPSNLITGLSYSPLSMNNVWSTPVSPGDIVFNYFYFTQSITNTLSSPVDIYTMMLVGALYGSRSASPFYIPITFYVFSPPIVLSPGVTMTVTVTLGFPIGIAYPST